jgi:hypothetical protein
LVIRKIDKERGSQLKSARQGALKYLEENWILTLSDLEIVLPIKDGKKGFVSAKERNRLLSLERGKERQARDKEEAHIMKYLKKVWLSSLKDLQDKIK